MSDKRMLTRLGFLMVIAGGTWLILFNNGDPEMQRAAWFFAVCGAVVILATSMFSRWKGRQRPHVYSEDVHIAVKPIKCPSCGAPVQAEANQSLLTCQYCGSSLEITPRVAGSEAEEDAARDAFITSIKQLLDDGHKIEAIKLYREQTGAALREAKEAVEAIERGEPIDVKR